MQDTEPTQIAESLLNEGWAMLDAVAQDFVSCGHEVTACIDERLLKKLHLSDAASTRVSSWLTHQSEAEPQRQCVPRQSLGTRTNGGGDQREASELPYSWWTVASKVDAVVVIAPEFSSILQTAISKLKPICKLLLNCGGDFLAASCDKWLTADRLDSARINHPATQLVCDVTERWLEQHRNRSRRWIIKPRDGAGCDAIQLVSDESVRDVLSAIRVSDSNWRMIIQPQHNGAAFSRSAIVDSAGRAHWLPLVTQEFTGADSIVYSGGRVLVVNNSHYEDTLNAKRYSIDRLDKVLNATIGALGLGAHGWVGVDLLSSEDLDDWLVIEVNPRLTTSFTGLSMSHGPGLMEHMVRAGQGVEVAIEPTWKSIAFNSEGKINHLDLPINPNA